MLETNDVARLAAMCAALRPDWPQQSLYTWIHRNLSTRGYRDCAVALAWVAADPKSDKPARVLEAGPWWQAAALGGASTHRPPRHDETCQWHPANWAEGCAGCAADQKAGEPRPPEPTREGTPPPSAYIEARRQLRPAGKENT